MNPPTADDGTAIPNSCQNAPSPVPGDTPGLPQDVPAKTLDNASAGPLPNQREEVRVPDWSDIESRQPGDALKEIQRLYDAGTPFFTKNVLKTIAQQAESLEEPSGEVALQDLTGTLVVMSVRVDPTTKGTIRQDKHMGEAEKQAIADAIERLPENDAILETATVMMAEDIYGSVSSPSKSSTGYAQSMRDTIPAILIDSLVSRERKCLSPGEQTWKFCTKIH